MNWGGFADPHSGIMYYRFCVGSENGICDEMAWEDVGLRNGQTGNCDTMKDRILVRI